MNNWIVLGAICSLAGCAATGNAPARNGAAPPDAARAGCVSQTGSLIAHAGSTCIGPGHTYSQSDIASTGETTIGGVLRKLDPSITISR
jgi:hypothetical protein